MSMADNSYTRGADGFASCRSLQDFLSEGGKLWPLIRASANRIDLLDNLRTIDTAKAGIQIFVVPHHRWESGDYESWDHPNPTRSPQVGRRLPDVRSKRPDLLRGWDSFPPPEPFPRLPLHRRPGCLRLECPDWGAC